MIGVLQHLAVADMSVAREQFDGVDPEVDCRGHEAVGLGESTLVAQSVVAGATHLQGVEKFMQRQTAADEVAEHRVERALAVIGIHSQPR